MASQVAAGQSRITVSLPPSLLKFLLYFSQKQKKSKSAVVQEALKELSRRELEEDLKEGAIANAELDVQLAEEGMADWWEIVKSNGDEDGWWEK